MVWYRYFEFIILFSSYFNTDDSPYLENLQKALSQAFEEFTPQLIIYVEFIRKKLSSFF